ncbi:MAG: sulfurtransferase TusA family protein [Candidatus Calescibacterium sp.]|nr:sulfurtransferase TusA family protein [Candidatus Calescibacterium sp.]MCS7243675.1 sulfurtransferase TusA family protein [Candidatus Calescibacterium sp.]MDW8132593.1 sulfurtransferase TusA family protein [Candidatus Calescibacterium sp.]
MTNFDVVLDVKGLSCPMPLVKTKQELNKVQSGTVIKVIATDKGSIKDFQGWANTDKTIELISQSTEKDENGKEIYIHYVKKK